MLRFIISRILESILTVAIAVVLIFAAVRLAPGDPAELLLPRGAPPNQIAALRQQLGLDDPLPVQFGKYVRNLSQGDLGTSLQFNKPALTIILQRLPATIELAVAAMVLALLLAVPLGVLSALRPGSMLDNAVTTFTIATQSVPSFWLGVQLILIFSLTLRLLPSSGSGSLTHLVLPTITLAADVTALMTRIVRTEMISVLRQDFIRTAHAKGLESRQVLVRHAFRNAANPLVTVVGLRFGAMLGGAAITETVFAWPGIGQLVIQSVTARDYPMVQGIVLVAAIIFVTIHLFVDLLYAYLDPRARLTTG
jgi:ABC-type dipeptide/oligopeptide/nickel transport system permease component